MTDEKKTFNIFVTGGSESAGLATVKALLRNGHKVIASATDADGALAIRRTGALPVYPDLTSEGEILSVLRMANINVVVHAAPQGFGNVPQAEFDYASHADWLVEATNTVVQAAGKNEVEKIVSVSFGYLQGVDINDSAYEPMLRAEAAVLDGGIDGHVIRAGYIYGGDNYGTKFIGDELTNTRAIYKGTHTASWIHEEDLAEAIVALVEAESDGDTLAEIITVADDHPQSPNDFATELGSVLGFETVNFASPGFMTRLRGETLRDKLLKREIVLDNSDIKEKYGWEPQHPTTESGLDATTLTWRMAEATDVTTFYTEYEDKAADAIAALASGEVAAALPEEVEEEQPEPEEKEEPKPAKAEKPASPPPSDGPTPWNESEEKREERRRRALERKKKRAEKRAAGG